MGDAKLMKDIKEKKFIIVTHSYFKGSSQELRDFLIKRSKELVFIGHPFSYCQDIDSSIEVHKNKKHIKTKKFKFFKASQYLFYIKDFILTLYWVLTSRNKFDIYFGVDPLNCFAGLILKKVGKVKKVVLFTIDYIPKNRFGNKLLNYVYIKLDDYCVKQSDYTWNISEEIIAARVKRGLIKSKKRHIVVPIGVNIDHNQVLPIKKINRKTIVYIGGMDKQFGAKLILKAIPLVADKISDVQCLMIGGGPEAESIKNSILNNNLGQNIKFIGFINDRKKLCNYMRENAVGLALYKPDKDSYKVFSDVTKPKEYMSFGMPVIINKVPPIFKKVEKHKLGIVINYDEEELANAIIRLLSNSQLYESCRKNAIRFVKKYKWNNIFEKAFKESFDQ